MNIRHKFLAVAAGSVVALAGAEKAAAQETPAPDKSPWSVTSMTVSAGPIASKHFFPKGHNYNERHFVSMTEVETAARGKYALITITPNSVRNDTVALGYVMKPYEMKLGDMNLEISGVFGLASGYSEGNKPTVFALAAVRLPLYQKNNWDIGLQATISPIVMTSPVLSVKYKF